MVHVEVVVYVVVFGSRPLQRRIVRSAIVVREERLAAYAAQKRLHASCELRLGFSSKDSDNRAMPYVLRRIVGVGVVGERRIGGALFENPFPPGIAQNRVCRHPAGQSHIEVSLVDKGDERKRRFVPVRPPSIGIDVCHQVLRVRAPVLERRFVQGAKRLEDCHVVYLAVAIDSDVPPLNCAVPRNKKIGCEIETFADRSGDQVVEPVHVFRIERKAVVTAIHRTGVIVVQSYRVVTEPLETHDHHLRLVMRREVRRAAEVHAVELDGLARTPLELEMPANVPQPSILAGWRIGEAHVREIECTARLDLLAVA